MSVLCVLYELGIATHIVLYVFCECIRRYPLLAQSVRTNQGICHAAFSGRAIETV